MSFAIEKEILDKPVAALQKQTGLQKESYSRFDGRSQSVDYKFSMRAPQEIAPRRFWANVKKTISNAAISEAVFQSTQAAEKFVLVARLDFRLERINDLSGGARLGYQKNKDELTVGLLRDAGIGRWKRFTCLRSLRNVEPQVSLIMPEYGFIADDSSRTFQPFVEDEL